ncbi:MAG TPA: potassium channel family protein [Terracidiphilus sp.]|nr:potassium channel family protein [Terracidiphilus sp.]
MRPLALVAGILFISVVLFDAFQTIILPRRATGRFRLTRLFYIATWFPWRLFARRFHHARRREILLGYYGPLSLIFLLVVWAAVMLLGFALVYYAIGTPFNDPAGYPAFATDVYVSGTTIFTLGLGDVTPHSPLARVLLILESGTGFGFLAVVMGYFPVLYAAFSRREVSISLLDARAGSPPTAAELMRRHSSDGAAQSLSVLLVEWERWSAELLESHISYPLLCYFRSQHNNQSWLSALTAILDTSSLLIAGVRGLEARQAQLTFAMARHALVDLSQIFNLRPVADAPDRLPPARCHELYEMLTAAGIELCYNDASRERLRQMRALYEAHAETLSRFLLMPLPQWFSTEHRKDNWQTVARLRAQTEAPGSQRPDATATEPGNIAGRSSARPSLVPDPSSATLHDRSHDF